MKVFLAGATGVLGHRVVEQLTDRGHEVHGLARDDDGADLVEAHGGVARHGDVLKPETLDSAVDDDVDVILHAATYFPIKNKLTDEDFAKNDRIRKEGIRNLIAAAGDGLDRFIFPSVIWVARQPDGSFIDETAERNPDRGTQSAADAEEYLQKTAAKRDFDATILRMGFYYAPDAGHTRFWGQELLSGDLPIVGGGVLGRKEAEMSFLHVEDSARAFADAIDEGITGLYHVVDEKPVTAADLFSTFADMLDAPEPSRVPGWLARFFVGKVSVNTLTIPFPTRSEKFRRDTGWEPNYPTYQEGLEQVIQTWEDEGTIRKTGEGYEWAGE